MKDYPLVKYVIVFILGILSSVYFNISLEFGLGILSIIALVLIVLYFTNLLKHVLLLNVLAVFIFGNLYLTVNQQTITKYPFSKTKVTNSTLYGEVTNITLYHSDEFKIIVKSDSITTTDTTKFIKQNFQCSISFKNKDRTKQLYDILQIGNKIKIIGTLRKGRGQRNPGEFDYYKYLQSKSISGLFYIKKSSDFRIVEQSTDKINNTIHKIRKWISEQIERSHNTITSGLLKGLLLADRSEIDYRTKENFINSGVIHVLAVSGLHVGFIVVIFLFLTSRFSIYPRTILTILGLIAFLLITNSPPSVFRATIMAVVMLLLFLSNRNYNSINTLSIAGLILLLINPSELFNPGFQLSFSAVLSILLFYPIISKRITTQNKIVRYLLLFTAVSFAAQIGTLPFTLMYFQKLSVISLLANLFVIPLIGIIVGLGILTIFVSIFSTFFVLYFASANMFFTDILMLIAKYAGSQSFSYVYIPNFSLVDGIIFYLFLTVIMYSFEKFVHRSALWAIIILVGLNLFIFLQLDNKQLLPDGKFSVVMIDIGQGDGILLKFPNGKTALIDAGNASFGFDNGERVIAPLLQRLAINKIDFGFISHVDSDHYKGFLSLIKNGWIKKIYKPNLDSTKKKDLALEKIIKENNVELKYYSKSAMMFGNLKLYILNDTTISRYKSFGSNNKSGIIKIIHGENSFLFVGDAEHEAENLNIKIYNNFLDSDVLKIGHHGSKSSSSQKFINAVTPKVGLISAGLNNSFGHPVKSIVERFINSNVLLYRTDIEGAIILQSDGKLIRKINWREF